MKRKIVSVALCGAMAASLLAGCGSSSSSSSSSSAAAASGNSVVTDTGSGAAAASGTSLRLVNGKIEVDSQLKKLASEYEKQTGVKVTIESMGGGIDIQSTLKGYYQADNMPDIFVCGSDSDFANWDGLLADMSDQEWTKDTDAAYTDSNGQVIGFPYTTEAIGLAYNADILKKAGIDTSTMLLSVTAQRRRTSTGQQETISLVSMRTQVSSAMIRPMSICFRSLIRTASRIMRR